MVFSFIFISAKSTNISLPFINSSVAFSTLKQSRSRLNEFPVPQGKSNKGIANHSGLIIMALIISCIVPSPPKIAIFFIFFLSKIFVKLKKSSLFLPSNNSVSYPFCFIISTTFFATNKALPFPAKGFTKNKIVFGVLFIITIFF